jgi:hypothetical protein
MNVIQNMLNPNFTTGFSYGEGCFSISMIKRPACNTGWGVYPAFIILVHVKDIAILRQIHSFFGVTPGV